MKKTIQLITLLALTLFTSHYANSKNPALETYLPLLPKGTSLSILVQTIGDKPNTLINNQSEQFKQPASTQKLVTALAATLELGGNYRFVTRLQTNGTLENQQLKGDLIVQMNGDPTLTRQDLQLLLSDIKKQGINKITGNIIIDTSVFASHDRAAGWSWNNLTACYSTAPAASIIDGNCFNIGIDASGKVGDRVIPTVAKSTPVSVTSQAIIIGDKGGRQDRYCEFDIVAHDNNQYQLTGCVRQNKEKSYFNFAITDSVNYLADILKAQLSQQNITFNGRIIEANQTPKGALTQLTSHQSAPLSELLTTMLKKSDNLIADTIFRTIGAHYYNQAGTWRNSSDAVKAILKSKAGIDMENTVIMDGSGLSRLDLISAEKLMQLLQYIAVNDQTLQIMAKLPVAGVDGTLQHRNSFRDSVFKSTIIAKTGYLEGNYNLAGYIKQPNGHYIAFVQFISGYNNDNQGGEPKNSAIMKFEQALYKGFITQ